MSWFKIDSRPRKKNAFSALKRSVLILSMLTFFISIVSPISSIFISSDAYAYPSSQSECEAQGGKWQYIGSTMGCTLPQSECVAQGGTWKYIGSELGCEPPSSVAYTEAIKDGCTASNYSLGLKSPFDATKGMCLGDAVNENKRFYQFIVKLASPVPVTITSSAKNDNSEQLKFIKQSDYLYVSKADSRGLGFGSPTISQNPTCDETSSAYKVPVTVTGPKNSQDFNINLCGYSNTQKASSQVLIYLDANKILDPNGNPTSSLGNIKGNLGIKRTDPLVPDKWKNGTLEQEGVTSISLSGPDSKTGDNLDTWYKVAGGMLEILNLKEGKYTLKIAYNDKIALQNLGGDSSWTTSNTLFEFKDIQVYGGEDSWINGSSETITYYQEANENASDLTQIDDEASVSRSQCSVDGIGWIVCPVMGAISTMNDAMYAGIENILQLNPLKMQDENGDATATYSIWQSFRDIANVLLVIAFILIIFSQVTSFGIDNYGIKKLLPKIVISAIAINLSYFVIMLGVDLVNVLGSTIHDLINGLLPNVQHVNSYEPTWTGLLALVGIGATGVAVGVVSGGLAGLALMAIPFLISAVLALLAAFLTLAVRNALVIVLAIIAPVAFAAFLLPNTKPLFDKWRKILMSMLFLYPMAALLFSGAKLAGTIIINTQVPGEDFQNGMNLMIGLTITAAPLFMMPWLAKSSGGILAKVGGSLDKLAKTGGQSIKKNAFDGMIANQKKKYDANKTGLLGFGTSKDRTMKNPERDVVEKELAAGRNKSAGETRKDWKKRQKGLEDRLGAMPHTVDRAGARRTWGSQLSNMQKSQEAEGKLYEGIAQENWRSDGTYGAPAGANRVTRAQARRASNVISAGETLELRKGATDARRKEIVSQSIVQTGSTNQQFDTSRRDAETGTATYSAQADQAYKSQILQGNQSNATPEQQALYKLTQQKTAADEDIKKLDTNLRVSHLNDQGEIGDVTRQSIGDATVSGARLETAETNIKTQAEEENTGVYIDLAAAKEGKKIEEAKVGSIVKSAKSVQGREKAINEMVGNNQDAATRAAAGDTVDRLHELAQEESIIAGSDSEAERARRIEFAKMMSKGDLTQEALEEIPGFTEKSEEEQNNILSRLNLNPEQRASFHALSGTAGSWGEGAVSRSLGRAFNERSQTYKDTVTNQKTVDSNMGVNIGDGKRLPTPPAGNHHTERLKAYIADPVNHAGITDEEVSASIAALGEMGGMPDIMLLAQLAPLFEEADFREEAQQVSARKFSKTEGPATGGGQVAKMGIPKYKQDENGKNILGSDGKPIINPESDAYDQDRAQVEFAAVQGDYTLKNFANWHEMQRNANLEAIARNAPTEDPYPNISENALKNLSNDEKKKKYAYDAYVRLNRMVRDLESDKANPDDISAVGGLKSPLFLRMKAVADRTYPVTPLKDALSPNSDLRNIAK